MPKDRYYLLKNSPLYGLSNKRKLFSLLRTDKKTVNLILNSQDNYSLITTNRKGKSREIANPKPLLKKIQANIHKLLSKIITPEYLFSGKKGLSYIDKAMYHIPCRFVTNYDIKNYYPACTREAVYRFFKYTLKMSDDLAWILTDLSTYKGSIPIGSPCSQILAYWTYKNMFDAINDVLKQNGVLFSLFVDDMTLSLDKPIVKVIDEEIKRLVEFYGHSLKEKKTKRYFPSSRKEITGCIVTPDNRLRVPNRRKKEIIDNLRDLKLTSGYIDHKKALSIIGKIQAVQQIEPNCFKNALFEIRRVLDKAF